MAARNNANIWFQYRHKFDKLFTADEQIIPLNTFSNTFTILGRHIRDLTKLRR